MKALKPIRESVTTINEDGSRRMLHPSKVTGPFTRYRALFATCLVAIFVLLPWIQINGHPALFFNIIERRFHIFGMTFAAQDFWMAYFFITGLGFTLFFITALLGRVWCGWACPQTIFMEFVFRPIERLIDGDRQARHKIEDAPMDVNKFWKRLIKITLFGCVAILIAHCFIAYFISIPQLHQWILQSPAKHWDTFLFMVVMSTLLFLNFYWFREQLCLVICPYGRLQSALIDDDSIIIGYDTHRGEPRNRHVNSSSGDCIDCKQCVQVCPTGIDIRQGLQMECIGCANCIDACNRIMGKLSRPKGLIRYDSLNGFNKQRRRILRPRIFLYSVLLLLGAGVFAISARHLHGMHMNVVRMSGPPFYQSESHIRNQYMVRIINKTNQPKCYSIGVQSDQTVQVEGDSIDYELDAMGEITRPLIIQMDAENYQSQFNLEIYLLENSDSESAIITRKAQFLGPNN